MDSAAFHELILQVRGAAAALKTMLGRGPTRSMGHTRATHPLAPYVALFALLPLASLFSRKLRLQRR